MWFEGNCTGRRVMTGEDIVCHSSRTLEGQGVDAVCDDEPAYLRLAELRSFCRSICAVGKPRAARYLEIVHCPLPLSCGAFRGVKRTVAYGAAMEGGAARVSAFRSATNPKGREHQFS